MKRSNRLVILVGLLLAVLAFVAIIIVLNNSTTNAPAAVTVKVLVARDNIAIGTPVTPDLVDVQDVAPDAVVATRIPDKSLLTGRPALFAIVKGQQVTQEAAGIGNTPTINIEGQLQPGEKAIAFQVDRVTGLDFLLQPGDHIDIVLAQDVQPVQETQDSVTARRTDKTLQPRYELVNGLNNVRTVKTILQDRRVLYVSATRVQAAPTGTTASPTPAPAQQAQQQQFEVVIIVFAGTDQDAELIKFAQSNLGEQGALTAILRDTQDPDHAVKTTGVTLDGLIKQYGVPIPKFVVLPPQSPAP